MLMFLETIPADAAISLLVTNPSFDTVASVTFTSSLIDDTTFDVQPQSQGMFPVPPGLRAIGTGRSTSGVMITSSSEVAVHGFSNGDSTCGGFLAIPVEKLGYEYYTISRWLDGFEDRSVVGVVATENNTTVVIQLSRFGSIEFEGVTYSGPNGDEIVVTLDMFESVQLVATGGSDFSWSRVIADNPVAVFSGNVETRIQSSSSDHMIEQMLPVSGAGRIFNLVPVPGRNFERITLLNLGTVANVTLGRSNEVIQVAHIFDTSFGPSEQLVSDTDIIVARHSVGLNSGQPGLLLVTPEVRYKSVHIFHVPSFASGDHTNHITIATGDVTLQQLRTVYLDGMQIEFQQWNTVETRQGNRYGATLPVEAGLHRVYSLDGNVRLSVSVFITRTSPEQCTFAFSAGMCLDYEPTVRFFLQIKIIDVISRVLSV